MAKKPNKSTKSTGRAKPTTPRAGFKRREKDGSYRRYDNGGKLK